MRVGLDITQAVKRKGRGIAQYIRQVVPPLEITSPHTDLTLCIRGSRWFKRSLISTLAPASPRGWLPFNTPTKSLGLDLFHSFGNHLPKRSPVPCTFTVHDVRKLDRQSDGGGRHERLHRNIERAAGIICLTEYGKNRLQHYYPDFDAANIAAIPHGVDHSVFYPRETGEALTATEKHAIQPRFILQLGSWFPHKNLELSIEAFAQSRALREDYSLVFVGGGAKPEYRASLDTLANKLGIADRIKWVENVSWPDIPKLLSAAGCMLQPSRYEGFGLPLLEAMAVGTPGVISDSSCLPEVSGGIWPIADQDDPANFAAGIDTVLFDHQCRQIAVEAGLERAAGFNWETTARKSSEFFHHILS